VTQRGLRDETSLGRSGEAQRGGHLDDVTHLLQFHPTMIACHANHEMDALDSSE
jgi:hypothetical protein